MTDKDIINSLQICFDLNSECEGCSYISIDSCKEVMKKDVLELLKRQQAEIDGLRYNAGLRKKRKQVLKAEATKEFAEKLKTKEFSFPDEEGTGYAVKISDIDKLVKEMTGEQL